MSITPPSFLKLLTLLLTLEWAPLPAAELDNPGRTGSEIVAEVRDLAPDGASEWTGTMKIRAGGKTQGEIPVRCQVTPTSEGWTVTYTSLPVPGYPKEKLVVKHVKGRANEYLYAQAETEKSPLPALSPLPRSGISKAFVRSDYSIADLGLDFLHWPKQEWMRFQIYRSTGCDIVESRVEQDSTGPGYVKVVSRIDRDTGAILLAEAYDKNNKLVKEFYPKAYFTKRRQPKEARMTSSSGSQTTLIFDVDERK